MQLCVRSALHDVPFRPDHRFQRRPEDAEESCHSGTPPSAEKHSNSRSDGVLTDCGWKGSVTWFGHTVVTDAGSHFVNFVCSKN